MPYTKSLHEKLELAKIETMLTTHWLGRSTNELLDTIDSTNNRAMELARDSGKHGTMIIAAEQTAGRGRSGRTWFSPAAGGLYISFLLRPKTELTNLPIITLVTGVAIAQAIQKCLNIRPGLKWVNDLIVDGKKIGGILCEYCHSAALPAKKRGNNEETVGADAIRPGSRVDSIDPSRLVASDTAPRPYNKIGCCANDKTTVNEEPVGASFREPAALIIGIGLNLHKPDTNLPPDLAQKIGFLQSHLPSDQLSIDRNQLIASITNELESVLNQMQSGNLPSLLDKWRAYSITLGEEIVAEVGDKQITGQALDITDTGELTVKTNSGNITLCAGEVSIRRTTGSYI